MSAEDRNGEVSTDEKCSDCSTQERSFDDLTKGLASATVSRRGALRLLAGALFGGVLASVPGVGRTAQAVTAPGGSTCNTSGQSCTNQHCCEGYTCLEDATSGTDKFCCPDLLVCGSRCCPQNASCATGQRCECPANTEVCPGGPTPQVGECVDLQTEERHCGSCLNACNVAAGEACCSGSCKNLLNDEQNCGACGRSCGANETCIAGVCCPNVRVCGNTCLVTACDPTQCEVCDPVNGRCDSTCTAGQTCCNGICCDNATTTCISGVCCPNAKVCGNTCLVTACDPTQCEVCDPVNGRCVSSCTGSDVCVGGVCCPAANVCGNTCLATACDPTQCQVCDPLNGRCVSTCPTGQTCPTCTAPKVLDPTTCSCVCATVVTCTPPKVFNQNTCTCECPGTCGENQVFNDQCVCVCSSSSRTCADGKCCPPDTACDCRPKPGGGVQCNCRRL